MFYVDYEEFSAYSDKIRSYHDNVMFLILVNGDRKLIYNRKILI